MKTKTKARDLHTSTDLPFIMKVVQNVIKVIYFFSKKMAKKLVIKLFCRPSKSKQTKSRNKFYASGKTEILSIRGFDINIFIKGKGPVIFVNHGWNSDAYNLRHIIEDLIDQGYQVIAPDMACHGRSSGSSIDQIEMAFVLEQILLHYNKRYDLEYVVTHSWGGTVMLLTLDLLYKKGIELPIKKMISLSMPSKPNAIMDLFCNLLDLNEDLREALEDNLVLIANKDNRTLNEAFPYYLDEFIHEKSFELELIHDAADKIIPFENSTLFAKKYPKTNLTITNELGHLKILKSRTTKDLLRAALSVKSQEKVTKNNYSLVS
jgi:pimeloyl-ACP methyl ester carboxylesterase